MGGVCFHAAEADWSSCLDPVWQFHDQTQMVHTSRCVSVWAHLHTALSFVFEEYEDEGNDDEEYEEYKVED